MQVSDEIKNKMVFVTGGTGFLGSRIMEIMREDFSLYSHYRGSVSGLPQEDIFPRLELTDKNKLLRVIEFLAPEVIVHTAALTNVDYCEMHPQTAFIQNVLVTENVVDAAEEVGAKLVYISTDQVFDGSHGNYKENDRLSPINVYGKTKAEAEKTVLNSDVKSVVIRTNFYGCSYRQNMSFAEWILNGCETGEKLNMFDNVFFTPVYIDNLVEILREIIEKEREGVFHLGSHDRLSKFEFGKKMAQIFGFEGNNIIPLKYDLDQLKAPRPLDMSLDSGKARAELETELVSCATGLIEMKQHVLRKRGN